MVGAVGGLCCEPLTVTGAPDTSYTSTTHHFFEPGMSSTNNGATPVIGVAQASPTGNGSHTESRLEHACATATFCDGFFSVT